MNTDGTFELDDVAREELRAICTSISAQQWDEETWAAHESCDEFQTSRFCGGFEALENEFCFSYYRPDGKEFWFQFSLAVAERIALGHSVPLRFREPS